MTDGNIIAARKRLNTAIDRLCAPRLGLHHKTTLYAPSLYASLRDDLAGQQGDHKSHAKSQPPLWVDACQLLADIDHQARRWSPRGAHTDTPTRMHRLAEQQWRPQDTDHVTDITNQIQRWCETINNMLDPQSVKTISAACPSCGRRTVMRRDSAGENVRQPALRIVTNQGCTCLACQAHWAPDRYLFLCRLLGFQLPEGVLE